MRLLLPSQHRGALAAMALLAFAAPSHAEQSLAGGHVALTVSACASAFEVSLREILLIELGDLVVWDGGARGAEGESIEIRCEAEMARIVGRGARGEVMHNDLRLDAFPGDAAPRAVALAALEALRAVDPTLAERMDARRAPATPSAQASPAPAPPPERTPKPRANSDARSASGASSDLTRLLAGGVVRGFLGQPRTLVFGGRLELSRRFASRWDAGVELDGTLARRTVELGVLDARLLSAAAWVGLRLGSGAWSATAGVGGRFGLALLSGAPRDAVDRGHRSTRPWGGPTLVIRTDAAVDHLAVGLALEGGFAAAGSEGLAAGRAAIGFTDGWASVSASAGIGF